jgi:alginate O-acetyltransferase complex protein AlgI
VLFSSLTFLYAFLPATLLAYYAVPSRAWRNGVLILSSLIFYAWGEPVWTILLIASAAADYIHGRVIEANRGTFLAKAMVASSLIVNLGLLAIFKYSGMIVESFNALTGLDLAWRTFALPIGISFYTFQTISYTIDVYRGRVSAQTSFWKFLLFVSLFHQLVAGPIVRYRDIEREIEHRNISWRTFSSGISRFAIGLGKKVIIANAAGEVAASFLDGNLADLPLFGAWWGMLMFAFQIYFDFSGYSDMAIGLGRMFGFHYQENFRHPYVSRSAGEFWRRWHISLGSFFRDYLYIPLGGNRRHVLRNLMVVWFLTGLWHGASWNFVLWGLYYGVLIAAERGMAHLVSRAGIRIEGGLPGGKALSRIFGHFYLIFITLVGWSLFYFTDLGRMGEFLQIMFGRGGAALLSPELRFSFRSNINLLILAAVASTPLVPRFWKTMVRRSEALPAARNLARAAEIVLLMASTALLVGSSYNPFLYFRF